VRGKINPERAEVSVGAEVRLELECRPIVDKHGGVMLVKYIEGVALDGAPPPLLRRPSRLRFAFLDVLHDGRFDCLHESAQQRWSPTHVMTTKPHAWLQLVQLLEHRLQ
jgi:hypothetical protein